MTDTAAPERTADTVHILKVWPDYFDRLEDGSKPFEIRKNDRDFHVGDVLDLREYAPGPDEYTGRHIYKRIAYLISGDTIEGYAFGLRPGFVALGLIDFSAARTK